MNRLPALALLIVWSHICVASVAADEPPATLPGTGAGPGRLGTPPLAVVQEEFSRARALVKDLKPQPETELVVSREGQGPFRIDRFLNAALKGVGRFGTMRTRLHHLRASEHLHRRGPVPNVAAQGERRQEDALFDIVIFEIGVLP